MTRNKIRAKGRMVAIKANFSHFLFSRPLSLVGRRKWQPTPVFLPGEPCGQRILVGCCPQGCTESHTTEVTQHECMHWRRKWQPTLVFQYSCLENPRDREAWWAAVYGVAESQLDTTEATQQQQQQQQSLVMCIYVLKAGDEIGKKKSYSDIRFAVRACFLFWFSELK